jgi:hypothetical protein
MTCSTTTWTTRSEDWPDWRKGLAKPRLAKKHESRPPTEDYDDSFEIIFYVSLFLFPWSLPITLPWAAFWAIRKILIWRKG